MATLLNAGNAIKGEVLSIVHSPDCRSAQRAVRQLASTLCFSLVVVEEIVLAVAELAASLLKHERGGSITLRPVVHHESVGMEVESFGSGNLGCGLGMANRLMDEIDIYSAPSSGRRIVCRRWLNEKEDRFSIHSWDVGVYTRSKGDVPENGDAFLIKHGKGQLLVGLIDGLGHG
jgi:anti-sigma regulatory factor (Ser/Thr protein kinase)